MSSITPPTDDAGVQSLRQNNKAATGVESVSTIAAKRAIHPSTGAPATNGLYIEKRRLVDRRSEDRRRKERRDDKNKVLLDTRSHHDRRTTERRNSINKSALKKRKHPHTRGVDIKV